MRDIEFIKFPRIPHIAEVPELLNQEVEIYEKLDGGNTQIRKNNWVILAGNRSKFLTDNDKRFQWFQKFLKWAKGNHSFYNLPENLVVYGEWLSKHKLDYDSEKKDKFYLIDIFDTSNNRFLEYSESKNILRKLQIKDVNFLRQLFKGKTDMKGLEKIVKMKSDYRDGRMEGIIIKDYKSPMQRFAKLLYTTVYQNKKPLSLSDVREYVVKMEESGKNINPDSVFREISSDLRGQRIKFSEKEVMRKIKKYLKNISSYK